MGLSCFEVGGVPVAWPPEVEVEAGGADILTSRMALYVRDRITMRKSELLIDYNCTWMSER